MKPLKPFLVHKHIKPRGNISLIMLFVLAIGSLIGLMSTTVIQNMITSSGQLRDFYHSYYLAQAGLELGTLAIHKHQYGYEDNITYNSDTSQTQTNSILSQNLNCKKSCALDIRISSHLGHNTNTLIFNKELTPVNACTTNDKPFTLAQGQSLILPLFMDERKLSDPNKGITNIFNQRTSYNISLSPVSSSTSSAPTLSVILGSTNQATYDNTPDNQKTALSMTGTNIATLLNSRTAVSGNGTVQSIRQQFNTDPNLQKQDEDNYNYLAITNTNSDNYQFCLKVEKGSTLITDTSHVEVISRYNDTALGFQAIVYEPLLDYIIRPNTSLEMN